jgi:hypothetical protein
LWLSLKGYTTCSKLTWNYNMKYKRRALIFVFVNFQIPQINTPITVKTNTISVESGHLDSSHLVVSVKYNMCRICVPTQLSSCCFCEIKYL